MELAHRWGDRNLTKLEYIFAILIFAVLIGIFSRHVLMIFSRAEQGMISSTVININTALYYRAAMAEMRGEYDELELLRKINPMEQLQSIPDINDLDITMKNIPFALTAHSISTPANYGGEINAYTMESMEKGKWYFNQDNRHLVYYLNNSQFFSSNAGGLPIIQFRVEFAYEDRNSNGLYDPGIDEFKTMKLDPVGHYQWNY